MTKDHTTITISWTHFLFIGLISILVLLFPILIILVMMPLTIISLILSGYPIDFSKYSFLKKKNVIIPFLHFLHQLGVLNFFISLNSIVFYTITKIYYIFFFFCYGLTFLYFLVSRYYFYHLVVLKENFSTLALFLIYFLLFLTFCGSYLRTLINVSSIIVVVTRRYLPDLLDHVLRVDPSDIPPPEPKRSLFSFSRNTHNHHYPPQPKNTTWGRAGILIACGGLLVSSITDYHTSQQTQEAIRQTQEARRSNSRV